MPIPTLTHSIAMNADGSMLVTGSESKVLQLWNVGGGLPLDAFKKGAIVEWSAGYQLDEGEILQRASKGSTMIG